MRARNVKPGLFANEDIGQMPYQDRWLFIGLWCAADRNGMLEYRPARIATEIFRYDPKTQITVNSRLDNLKSLGLIRYVTDGTRKYIHVVNFLKHQNPHHTEKESGFPLPESCEIINEIANHGELTVNSPLRNGEYPADSLIPDSLIHRFTDSLIREQHEVAPSATKPASEQAAKQKQEKRKAIPTQDELTAYFLAQGSTENDAAACFDYYTGNGWVQGKARAPIKDWKSTARQWIRRIPEFKVNGNGRIDTRTEKEKRDDFRVRTRNYCPDADADAERRRVLGLSPREPEARESAAVAIDTHQQVGSVQRGEVRQLTNGSHC